MSDKKQQSNQTSTATYGFQTPPDTADISAARNFKAEVDPTIGFRAAEKERQLDDSFVSPTGGYTTPQIRDAITRSGQRSIMQEAGAEQRAGQFDVNRLNQSRLMGLASLTKPDLVQTGGTSSGTTVQSQSPFGTIAQIGGSVAPLSL